MIDSMRLRRFLLPFRRRARPIGLGATTQGTPNAGDYRALAGEIDAALVRHDVVTWFPRCIEKENGGFVCGYGCGWQRLPEQVKALVYQSRLTWFAAQVSERMGPEDKAQFLGYARHGLAFLREKMWDDEHGGLFWRLDERGNLPAGEAGEKYVYGIAFAIYASANLARVSGDEAAREFAERIFRWLETHAVDEVNGGYHEILDREGRPITSGPRGDVWSKIGTAYGYKSANTHIHVLEALIELYRAWPDPLVRARLAEMLFLVRDRMFVAPGCIPQNYTADFRPLPGLISYGHDVESAFLLVEAARALGQPEDDVMWDRPRLLVDYSLRYAFDGNLGGIYDSGAVFENAGAFHKVWWAQAEALNAFYLMHGRFGAGDSRYWSAFTQTWNYIKAHAVDARHGGWYSTVWMDDKPLPGTKSEPWKDPYHESRALLNISRSLWQMAGAEPPMLAIPSR